MIEIGPELQEFAKTIVMAWLIMEIIAAAIFGYIMYRIFREWK